jgi:hypothetical protein
VDLNLDLEALVGDALALAPDKAFSLFLDVAAQHRDAAAERGFSPEAAEHMATSLHSGLVALYFTSAQ